MNEEPRARNMAKSSQGVDAGRSQRPRRAITGLVCAGLVVAVAALHVSRRVPALLEMPMPLSARLRGARGRRTPATWHSARTDAGQLLPFRDHVLYHDQRGTALESSTDSWSFSHVWTGSVDLHEREQTVVPQPQLKLAKRSAPPAVGHSMSTLKDRYNAELVGEWKAGQAAALLETLDGLCSTSVQAKGTPAENCAMQALTTWVIHEGSLVEDVRVSRDEEHGDGDARQIEVAKRALDFASARGAKLDGNAGTVVSRRLQFAVLRVVSDYGRQKAVVGQILNRKFGAQLHVDPGYTTLTSTTTIEDAERFQHFKTPELLFMLEAWTLMPPNMYNVAGLKYVTRRQQGLDHPLYGSTTAVSWPTNLDQSYQEYMDYSFNNDGYTSRHLFIHEKTHFFWGRHWDRSLKEDWERVGAWTEQDEAGVWETPITTAFSSDYGASNNPDEDLAECMAAYVLHPVLLQARAPDKNEFIAKRIANGVRHLERPDVTVDVPNDSPYRRYPASLKKVDIRVTGGPAEDKQVDVMMMVDVGRGWHSPVHALVSLAGPSGGSKSLELHPDQERGGQHGIDGVVTLRATESFSRLYEKGFWSASQIKIKDKLGNERYVISHCLHLCIVVVGCRLQSRHYRDCHADSTHQMDQGWRLLLEAVPEQQGGHGLAAEVPGSNTQASGLCRIRRGGRPALSRCDRHHAFPRDRCAAEGNGSCLDAPCCQALGFACRLEVGWLLGFQLPNLSDGNLCQG